MRTLCVAVTLCTLSACESIIELETPFEEHKILAHSFFTPDSVWAVNLNISTHTSGSPAVTLLSGNPSQTIVVIADDQGGADTLREPPEKRTVGINYRSVLGMRPRPGVTYTLRVEMPGFIDSQTLSPPPPVEASAQLPQWVSMQNIVYSNDDETSSLRFVIEDPPGANYYRLELFQVGPEDGGAIRNNTLSIPGAVEDSFNYRKVSFRSTDPSLRLHYGQVDNAAESRGVNFDFYGHAVFSDALFNGMAHDMGIAFKPYTYEGFEPRFLVVLSTLSYDFFMYHHTLDRHRDAGVGSDYAPEVFPVPVYTNIKNGYGIFARYVSDSHRFDLDGNEW